MTDDGLLNAAMKLIRESPQFRDTDLAQKMWNGPDPSKGVVMDCRSKLRRLNRELRKQGFSSHLVNEKFFKRRQATIAEDSWAMSCVRFSSSWPAVGIVVNNPLISIASAAVRTEKNAALAKANNNRAVFDLPPDQSQRQIYMATARAIPDSQNMIDHGVTLPLLEPIMRLP